MIELEPSPHAPRDARQFVTGACARWQLEPILDDAALVVSELVTNAVLHARTRVEVSLCVAAGKVEIAVRDHDPRPPVLRPPRTDLLADLDFLASQPPQPGPPQSTIDTPACTWAAAAASRPAAGC